MDTLIAIRIDKSLKEKLQKLADKSRRKLSDYCRLIFQEADRKQKVM